MFTFDNQLQERKLDELLAAFQNLVQHSVVNLINIVLDLWTITKTRAAHCGQGNKTSNQLHSWFPEFTRNLG